MKDNKDPNYVIKVEKAIAEKYGEEAIVNPKSLWSTEKENQYLQQLKEIDKKYRNLQEKKEKIEVNGVLISKKLLNKDNNRTCPICDTYSFKIRDDVYMNKYGCCFGCYVQWIEGREQRWAEGWRPGESKE
jgi:hypothetical protein